MASKVAHRQAMRLWDVNVRFTGAAVKFGNAIHSRQLSESIQSMFRKHDLICKKVSDPPLTMIPSYIVPVMSNRCPQHKFEKHVRGRVKDQNSNIIILWMGTLGLHL